jgi:hypothetical protein
VNTLLQDFQECDELFRLNASYEDLEALPKVEYGKKDTPGLFRVALSRFGDFQENYISYVGEENLKKMRSLEEFVKALKKVNDTFALKAKELKRLEVKMHPVEKDLLADYKSEEVNRRVQKRYDRPQLKALLDGPPLLNEITHYSDSDKEEQSDISKIEGEVTSEFMDNEVLAFQARNKGPTTPSRIIAPRPAPVSAGNICFKFFNTGSCEEGSKCSYSHDPVRLRQFGEEKLKQLKQSPFMKDRNSLNLLEEDETSDGEG